MDNKPYKQKLLYTNTGDMRRAERRSGGFFENDKKR
jgi:hypothetical protein